MNICNDLITEIERHKGVFHPSKQHYLDWVFRYTCRFLELHDLQPSVESNVLYDQMRTRFEETLDVTKRHYLKHNTLCIIYTPCVECIDDLLEYDIKNRGLDL